MATMNRVLSTGVAILALSASVAGAESLSERMDKGRMTVLKIDRERGRFECVEHKQWTTVSKKDLEALHPGDVVRVTPRGSAPAHITIVRSAADELSSPER